MERTSDEEYFRNSSIKPAVTVESEIQIDRLLISDKKEKIYIPFPTLNVYSKTDFEVVELLGKGAYAKVVKARHIKTKEIKAIKIIDKMFMERVSIIFFINFF